MCSHCVQTCPRFPSDLKQKGKESLSPQCWQPPSVVGRALTIRFNSTFRVFLKKEKQTALFARQKRLTRSTRSPGCPRGGKSGGGVQAPAHRGEAEPAPLRGRRVLASREGQASPHSPGEAVPKGSLCLRRGEGV